MEGPHDCKTFLRINKKKRKQNKDLALVSENEMKDTQPEIHIDVKKSKVKEHTINLIWYITGLSRNDTILQLFPIFRLYICRVSRAIC